MQQLELAALEPLIEAHKDWLRCARAYAQGYSIQHGSVSSDAIREWCDRTGNQPSSPHAFGAVLLAKGFLWIGRKKSEYASNNSRWINVYRWQP